jgi:hypothetical protein
VIFNKASIRGNATHVKAGVGMALLDGLGDSRRNTACADSFFARTKRNKSPGAKKNRAGKLNNSPASKF